MTIDELLVAYRQAAITYGEASEEGAYRVGNRAFDELLELRKELRRVGPGVIRAFLSLLSDHNVHVRLCAGIDALEFSPAEGERVLSKIAQAPRGMAGHEAEMTLKNWRSGELTVPWWTS